MKKLCLTVFIISMFCLLFSENDYTHLTQEYDFDNTFSNISFTEVEIPSEPIFKQKLDPQSWMVTASGNITFSGSSITLPAGESHNNYIVNWGDGSTSVLNSGPNSHNYTSDKYTISIYKKSILDENVYTATVRTNMNFPSPLRLFRADLYGDLVMTNENLAENTIHLYIEFFDVENNNSPVEAIKSNWIAHSSLSNLYYLDFYDSLADSRKNAMIVANAIIHLSEYYPDKIIICEGYSMGGVLLKLALSYLEINGISHNVAHSQYIDSPLRGSILNTDIQEFLPEYFDFLKNIPINIENQIIESSSIIAQSSIMGEIEDKINESMNNHATDLLMLERTVNAYDSDAAVQLVKNNVNGDFASSSDFNKQSLYFYSYLNEVDRNYAIEHINAVPDLMLPNNGYSDAIFRSHFSLGNLVYEYDPSLNPELQGYMWDIFHLNIEHNIPNLTGYGIEAIGSYFELDPYGHIPSSSMYSSVLEGLEPMDLLIDHFWENLWRIDNDNILWDDVEIALYFLDRHPYQHNWISENHGTYKIFYNHSKCMHFHNPLTFIPTYSSLDMQSNIHDFNYISDLTPYIDYSQSNNYYYNVSSETLPHLAPYQYYSDELISSHNSTKAVTGTALLDGLPVSGIHVELLVDNEIIATTSTNEDGRYKIGFISSANEIVLSVPIGVDTYGISKTVQIDDDPICIVDLNLRAINNSLIVGRVGDTEGFEKVQDALDYIYETSIATDNYKILVLPGIYNENLQIKRPRGGLNKIEIIGSANQTIFKGGNSNSRVVNLTSLYNNGDLDSLVVKNIIFEGSSNYSVSGAVYCNNHLNNLIIDNCTIRDFELYEHSEGNSYNLTHEYLLATTTLNTNNINGGSCIF